MSNKLFQNKPNEEIILPRRKFECTRCNQDLLKPMETWNRQIHRLVRKERPYTYYYGKLVCMKCCHELEEIGI